MKTINIKKGFKTKKQFREEVQTKLYREIIGSLYIGRAIEKYGEKDVKWAIQKYLVGIRERARLLKEQAEAQKALDEINRKL